MNIELWEVGKLQLYENNPRVNKKAVKAVKNSIEEFGWKQPIVIDENGIVIVGHTRLLAAKELGCDRVPCVVASDLTEEQCRQYRIADNSTADVAEWDIEKLIDECEKMPDFDFANFGLDLEAIIAEASGLMADEESEEGKKQDDRIVVMLEDMSKKAEVKDAILEAIKHLPAFVK